MMKWIYRVLAAWMALAVFVLAAPFDDPEPLSVDATTRNQDNDSINLTNANNTYAGTFNGIVQTEAIIDRIRWVINGPVAVGTDVDGLRSMDRSGVISNIVIMVGDRGNTGTTVWDINKFTPAASPTNQQNGTVGSTIYTNQANRPSITGDTPNKTQNAIFQAVTPDVISFAAGDFFTLDTDSVTPSMRDATIEMFLKYDD